MSATSHESFQMIHDASIRLSTFRLHSPKSLDSDPIHRSKLLLAVYPPIPLRHEGTVMAAWPVMKHTDPASLDTNQINPLGSDQAIG